MIEVLARDGFSSRRCKGNFIVHRVKVMFLKRMNVLLSKGRQFGKLERARVDHKGQASR